MKSLNKRIEFDPIVIDFDKNEFLVLDQLLLPLKEEFIKLNTVEDVYKVIKFMNVRGAPLIGIVALIGLYLSDNLDKDIEYLKQSRPTAVNMFNYFDQVKKRLLNISDKNVQKEVIREFILEIIKREEEMNLRIAINGFNLLKSILCEKFSNNERINFLTHCNTGSLATIGLGTALGIIKYVHRNFSGNIFVWVDETRPYLQGSRLTAWELNKENIDFKIITDSTAAFVMSQKMVDVICVGADRIAKNGDTANKIGTLNLAILSKYFQIPFIVAAPKSSVDLSLDNLKNFKVELRDKNELNDYNYPVYNPSFDVTPKELIDYIVLDDGVYEVGVLGGDNNFLWND